MIRLFQVAMSPAAKHEVGAVLDSGYIGEGPKVKEFEAALESVLGHKVLAVNSCTSAIDLALHLCDVGPGDEVIVTPMTCSATVTMLANRRAKIVWADVFPETGLINAVDVERKVTAFTKAIIAVDWGGSICDFETLRHAATIGSKVIPIIEDAAHVFGSHLRGSAYGMQRRLNPIFRGHYSAYSFQAIKHLTTGDGGALHVPESQYKRAKLLRWFGLNRESSASFRCAQTIDEAGYKYHMNDIAAAIGLANLPLALSNINRNRANAEYYARELNASIVGGPGFDSESSHWLYTILVGGDPHGRRIGRDAFIEKMKDCGVECSPVHSRCDKHPAFRGYGGYLPGLDYFASRQVAIPVGWWLTEADREYVVKSVQEYAT